MLDYGIIGNCKTCALIDKKGSIEWMCYPKFDSSSIFAKILDEKKGGSFQIIPNKKSTYKQKYIENTNILETTVENKDYSFKIIDFFPRYKKILPNKKTKVFKINKLVRIIEPIKGKPKIKIILNPKLEYAKTNTFLVEEENKINIKSENEKIFLFSNIENQKLLNFQEIDLNQRKYLVLGEKKEEYNIKKCLTLLNSTKRYWLKWVNTLILPDENKKQIIRSALVLKLLTYSETGSIIASPTTSIPEELNTVRTWDYRYCWIRDAAFCADTFKRIGRNHESKKLMEFIINLARKNDFIQPLYGIEGETKIKEYFLEHLDGFKNTKPIRIGNAAYNQLQNDIYGEIIDIMYLYFVHYGYEKKITKKYWRFLEYTVNQIKFSWARVDSGIWEFRGLYKHYTFSKLMCYVGIDRAIKIAQFYKKENLINKWLDLRDEIKNDILTNGYNNNISSFVMYYGGKELDASLLLMANYEFLENTDPRLINTIKKIYEKLLHNGYLVQRYSIDDDFGKSNSSFTVCSFWLASALCYINEKEKAKKIYDKLLKNSNHLGLYSEDINIKTKNLIGNFPQGYTHMALINTSIQLNEKNYLKQNDFLIKFKKNKWF
ncbi:MAG: glycoside hydrolase family 15 protein [Nanoarchaeota archaeon]